MAAGIVTRPFTAHIVGEESAFDPAQGWLPTGEQRLEAGVRISEEELELWGRSVDRLIGTGWLALTNEVVAGEATIDTLVEELKRRGDEVAAHAEGLVAHLLQFVEKKSAATKTSKPRSAPKTKPAAKPAARSAATETTKTPAKKPAARKPATKSKTKTV